MYKSVALAEKFSSEQSRVPWLYVLDENSSHWDWLSLPSFEKKTFLFSLGFSLICVFLQQQSNSNQ